MRVAVIGTGYVGLVVGAGLADTGNDVICADIDQDKIARLNRGEIPIYEPGLKPLVDRNLEDRRLTFSTDVGRAVRESEVVFIAVGTPPDEDGRADLQHVLADRDCVRARGWLERELVPVFGRHHLYAEGAAEAGAALLLDGDVFAEICRPVARAADVRADTVPGLVAVHRAVAALDALIPGLAQGYLDGEIGSEAAVDRLTADALVANGAGFLLAIEHQRTRVLAYPVGRRLVAAALAAVPPDARWRRFSEISTTLCLENS